MKVPASALGLFLLAVWTSHGFAQPEVNGRVQSLVFTVRDLTFVVVNLKGQTQDLQVRDTGREIHMELAADVLFDFDKATLRPSAQPALQQVAAIIRDHRGRVVRIEGHTDGKGADAYNRRLSTQRAKAVQDWLIAAGLGEANFSLQGWGASRPVAPNSRSDGSDNPEGRQKNRRVEIVVAK